MSFSVDDKAFSVNLSSDDQLRRFCKHVMATAAHVARFSDSTMSDPVLQVTNDDGSAATVGSGDTCGVVYACWELSQQAANPPHTSIAAAPTADNDGEMVKIKAGNAADEPFEGLAAKLIGMRAKATYFFVTPSSDPNLPWKFAQVDLVKHKKKSKTSSSSSSSAADSSLQNFPEPAAVETVESPAPASATSAAEAVNAEEDPNRPRSGSLADRMARLAAASGGGAIPGISSPTKEPEAAVASPSPSPPPAQQQAQPPPPQQQVAPAASAPSATVAAVPIAPPAAEAQPASLVVVPGQGARSHFANPATSQSAMMAAAPPPAQSHGGSSGDSQWAAMLLQQQQQSQSSLLNVQGTLMSIVSKIDKIDHDLQSRAVAPSVAHQLHGQPPQTMQQQHAPYGAMPYGYPNMHQMLPHANSPGAPPVYGHPGYASMHPPSSALAGGSSEGSVDADQAQELINRLVAEVKSLRAKVGAGGDKADEMKQKLDELKEKNSQLMSDKMELMQQAHSTFTKGSDTEKRVADLEATIEVANQALAVAEASKGELAEEAQKVKIECSFRHVIDGDIEYVTLHSNYCSRQKRVPRWSTRLFWTSCRLNSGLQTRNCLEKWRSWKRRSVCFVDSAFCLLRFCLYLTKSLSSWHTKFLHSTGCDCVG